MKRSFERVYFIGAGFSAGAQYPVGRDLMRRIVDYLAGPRSRSAWKYPPGFTNSVRRTRNDRERVGQLLGIIDQVLAQYFASSRARIDEIDVAEFFTMAGTLADSPWLVQDRRPGPGGVPAGNGATSTESSLFHDLAAVTRSYFHDICDALALPADLAGAIAAVRPDRDAIVNFNWDEEVDYHLGWNLHRDVSYTLGAWDAEHRARDPHVLVLKPHGSVGWYDVQMGIGNGESYFIAGNDVRIPRYEQRIVAFSEVALPLDVDGATVHSPLACPPVITAPTFAKQFRYIEQQRIWQDVLQVCQTAHEFVFLGYSLPRDDFLTRAAIRRALHENRARDLRCLVVDRVWNAARVENYRDVFGDHVGDHNHLRWDFGAGRGLAAAIAERFAQATL